MRYGTGGGSPARSRRLVRAVRVVLGETFLGKQKRGGSGIYRTYSCARGKAAGSNPGRNGRGGVGRVHTGLLSWRGRIWRGARRSVAVGASERDRAPAAYRFGHVSGRGPICRLGGLAGAGLAGWTLGILLLLFFFYQNQKRLNAKNEIVNILEKFQKNSLKYMGIYRTP